MFLTYRKHPEAADYRRGNGLKAEGDILGLEGKRPAESHLLTLLYVTLYRDWYRSDPPLISHPATYSTFDASAHTYIYADTHTHLNAPNKKQTFMIKIDTQGNTVVQNKHQTYFNK